jgi:hypothetical protein
MATQETILSADIVRLLWTGGWDSTYRLLSLLAAYDRVVEPHYIVTTKRRSFGAEIRTMARIKELILERWPEKRSSLLTSRITDVTDLHADPLIASQIRHLKTVTYLGSQYEYLARYAKQRQLNDLELCVEFSHHGGAYSFIKPAARWNAAGSNGFGYYEIPEPADDNVAMFGSFRFPLLDVSKVEMRDAAMKHGFADIMNHSWFCHRPLPGDRPCGECRPCGYAVTEGLGGRLPPSSRIRYYLNKAKKRSRAALHLRG